MASRSLLHAAAPKPGQDSPDDVADRLRAKVVGRPSVRPAVARRYPRLFAGDLAAAALLKTVLRRTGTSLGDLADNIDVSDNLVTKWVSAEAALPVGALFAIRHKRLAIAFLNAALDMLTAPEHA